MLQEPAGPAGPDAIGLAGTLCARLCHDLAGTLGALGGMLDMMAESAPRAPDPEVLALARACAQELSARLRLVRAAWGRDTEVPDLASLMPGLPGSERLSVDLAALQPDLNEPMRQLVLSLLLLAAASLPRGGTIHAQGGGRRISLKIAGVRGAWPATLEACLSHRDGLSAAGLEPRDVGVALACLQSRALGLRLTIVSPLHLEVAD